MQTDFLKFSQFTKVEETGSGDVIVWGISTQQKPDLDKEVCCYQTAVPVYKKWSDEAAKRTKKAGQGISFGNVRLQHGLPIGGKVTKYEFDDEDKAILLGSEPINQQIRDELKAGFYTGYSQGGSYAWRKCTDCGKSLTLQQANNWCPECKKDVTVLYGLKSISEVSYVDSPCSGVGFEYVKANGSREIVKFAKRSEPMELTQAQIEQIAAAVNKKEGKTKRVAGVDLPSHCFAYVGDPEKTETWKLPIEFPGDDAKTKSHIRNALARFEQTKGIPADKKAEVKAKIVAAAKKHGIEISEEGETKARQEFMAAIQKAAEPKGLQKGLWEVGELARILQGMAFMYEQSVYERDMEDDDSAVPEELKEILDHLVETFIAMAEEEARELAARTDKTTKGENSMTPEEIEKAAKLAKKKVASLHTKIALHHERAAAEHEKAAGHHETMCDACKAAHGAHKKLAAAEVAKADVESKDEPSAHIAAGDYYKAAGAHHEAMKSRHTKLHKCHMAIAEHHHALAEEHDGEESKAVTSQMKAEFEAADKLEKEATPAPVVPTPKSMEGDIEKEVTALYDSPEYKQAVKDMAKAKVEREIEELRQKTLAPDGVRLAATGTDGAGGLTIVKRAGESEQFKFAKSESTTSSAGI